MDSFTVSKDGTITCLKSGKYSVTGNGNNAVIKEINVTYEGPYKERVFKYICSDGTALCGELIEVVYQILRKQEITEDEVMETSLFKKAKTVGEVQSTINLSQLLEKLGIPKEELFSIFQKLLNRYVIKKPKTPDDWDFILVIGEYVKGEKVYFHDKNIPLTEYPNDSIEELLNGALDAFEGSTDGGEVP